MKNLYRILPILLFFLLAASVLALPAYASDSASPPAQEGGEEDAPESTGMTDAAAALGKALIGGIWSLFVISVPGFSFTFGQLWLGVLLASVSVLVVRMLFGFGGGQRGDSPRTSSTNSPRISKERRHDEF